ncbi:hypothetical protein Csal_1203 [Chromohalobacter israelensis DSM 3043]|uniref:Uncharacterized protein n=1 Tax=Chromohalobacter israelensis (strain ATCC BAA-138 / DSM 3043 / CIP 106854 / NCIMB 13768 / 1H11) TaxID=290398 RepID=Q1QYA0_CHRI1|nr:hypothetical protein Csal_1203 [Chromohalobacter salexigens DSM 3043]
MTLCFSLWPPLLLVVEGLKRWYFIALTPDDEPTWLRRQANGSLKGSHNHYKQPTSPVSRRETFRRNFQSSRYCSSGIAACARHIGEHVMRGTGVAGGDVRG